MKAIVFNEELLKRLTGSDKVKVLTEKRYNELLEKIDNLEKKLAIAIEALEWIDKHSDKFDCSWGVAEQLDSIKAQAQESLQQIKEVEE